MIDAGERPRRLPAHGFGEALADLRHRKRMSQARLADRAGLDHSAVSRLESGDRAPRPETVTAICRALDLDQTDTSALHMAAGLLPTDRTALLAHEPALASVLALLDGGELAPETKQLIRDHLELIARLGRMVVERPSAKAVRS